MAAATSRGRRGLRITGGVLAGRRLRAVGEGVRPTSERVREALFARLDPSDADVLDLYAGSGALGFEALSRGAASLVCVERSARVVAALRASARDLGLEQRVSVRAGEALRLLRRLSEEGRRFHLVFLDPPYASPQLEAALVALDEARVLAPEALVVIERSRRHPLPQVAGFELRDERRYGDTLITRLAPTATARGAEPGGPPADA